MLGTTTAVRCGVVWYGMVCCAVHVVVSLWGSVETSGGGGGELAWWEVCIISGGINRVMDTALFYTKQGHRDLPAFHGVHDHPLLPAVLYVFLLLLCSVVVRCLVYTIYLEVSYTKNNPINQY